MSCTDYHSAVHVTATDHCSVMFAQPWETYMELESIVADRVREKKTRARHFIFLLLHDIHVAAPLHMS